MKLLIIAQKVDRDDTIFSFFHSWLIEIAKHFEKVEVICLYKGSYELPVNVHVYSLGKEEGPSRFKYLYNFYSLIIKLRKEYDAVFVHQNQEYVILGSLMWKLWRKPVFMWRNHYAGSWFTDVAAKLCKKIFCTSRYSYTARFEKTVFMPVGVDTSVFKKDQSIPSVPNSILSLGRLAPSKNIEKFIETLATIKRQGVAYTATICGDALPRDLAYVRSLKEQVRNADLSETVTFLSGVPNNITPRIYSSHEIFVNQSKSGMFDKTIFEAMACENVTLVCNKDLNGQIDARCIFDEDSVADLAHKLKVLLILSADEKSRLAMELRKYAEEHHSLAKLATKLKEEMFAK